MTFGHVLVLADGVVLATYRAGATKDSPDETIEFFVLAMGDAPGRKAGAPSAKHVDGLFGSLKHCYLTELAPGHLLAASMWVDRESYPGQGLFNGNRGLSGDGDPVG